MLVAIVLTACLQPDEKTCRDERIEFKGGVMACVVEAQQIVAEWGSDHPDWRITGWKCGRVAS